MLTVVFLNLFVLVWLFISFPCRFRRAPLQTISRPSCEYQVATSVHKYVTGKFGSVVIKLLAEYVIDINCTTISDIRILMCA